MLSELKTPKEKNPNAPQKSVGLPFCDTNCFLVSLKVFLKQQIVFSFENSLSFLFFFTHNLDCKSLELPFYYYHQSGNLNFLISNRVVSECKFQEWKNSNFPKNLFGQHFFHAYYLLVSPLMVFLKQQIVFSFSIFFHFPFV